MHLEDEYDNRLTRWMTYCIMSIRNACTYDSYYYNYIRFMQELHGVKEPE